jgi:hypothetical protein
MRSVPSSKRHSSTGRACSSSHWSSVELQNSGSGLTGTERRNAGGGGPEQLARAAAASGHRSAVSRLPPSMRPGGEERPRRRALQRPPR